MMNSNKFRARLLAGASAAVISSTLGMGMSTAVAQSTTVYTPFFFENTGTATAAIATPVNQYNFAVRNAGVTDSFAGISSLTAGSASLVGNNTIFANAWGNQSNASLAISDPGAFISNQENGEPASVYSCVGNITGCTAGTIGPNTVGAEIQNSFNTGTITVDGNTVQALTQLNTASNSVGVTSGSGFTDESIGGVALLAPPFGGTLMITSGSVTLGTAQLNILAQQGAGSEALLDDNYVAAWGDYSDSVNEAISGVVSLQNNKMAATYEGNFANAAITAGGSLTFSGSLSLGTAQFNNLDVDAHGVAAENTDSTVYAEFAAATGLTNTLSGTLTVAGNTISSSASGNIAYTPGVSGAASTGNVITISPGLSVDDSALLPSSSDSEGIYTEAAVGSGYQYSFGAANIVVANTQVNHESSLTALTLGGAVTADVQDMSAGSGTVSVGNNAITATVNGNIALNAIVAGGNGTENIAATTLVQNVQNNDPSRMVSVAAGNAIAVTVATGTAGGSVDGAAIEVGSQTAGLGNTIGASAYGNQANNSVAMTVNNLTNTPPIIAGPTAGLGQLLTALRSGDSDEEAYIGYPEDYLPGGADIINVQSNTDDSPVVAVNRDASVSLTVGTTTGITTGSMLPSGPIVNSTLGVDNNSLLAGAVGNSAVSGFNLNVAGTFVGNAGIDSVQTQASGSGGDVVGVLRDAQVSLTVVPDFEGSTVTVTGNVLQASAQANYANNSITLTTNSYLNDSSGGSRYGYSLSLGAVPLDGSASVQPDAIGAFPIVNDQFVDTNVRADADSAFTNPVQLAFESNFTGVAHNDSNYFGAVAKGNQSVNSISIASSGGTIEGVPSYSVTLGDITNVQTVYSSEIYAHAHSFRAGIVTNIAGDIDGTVTLSNNEYQAQALGNEAVNSEQVTGAGSIQPDQYWNTAAEIPLIAQLSGTASQDHGLFVIANAQVANAYDVSSSISSGSVEAQLGTSNADLLTITGTVTLNGNSFLSSALDNKANNTISLAATDTLDGTGAVQSQQNTLTGLTEATAGSSFNPLRVEIQTASTETADTATLSVTNSAILATAYANTAGNSITLASGNVADSQSSNLWNTLDTNTGTTAAGIQNNTGWYLTFFGSTSLALYDGTQPSMIGADYALSNLQVLNGSVSASAYGEAAIELAATHPSTVAATLTTVTAAVSGNVVQADAEGNVAANSVSLSATNGSSTGGPGAPTIAIGSWQVAVGGVGATPTAVHVNATASGTFGIGQTFNTGTIAGSTLAVSNNAVNALAMANNVTNTLTVTSGNSLGDAYSAADLGWGWVSNSVVPDTPASNTDYVMADYVIGNIQNNLSPTGYASTVSATASVGDSFYWVAGLNLDHYSIDPSTLTVSGNQALAEAGSNTATNILSVSAANQISTTGAILNSQNNYATATADASGYVGISAGGHDTTITDSVMSVSANGIIATAWGNSAANSLTANSPNGFSAITEGVEYEVQGPGIGEGDFANANQVILNNQLNEAAVSATAGGVIGVRTGTGAINNTPISVTGNAVAATAAGSNAVNQMVLNGNNANVVEASGQVNTGAITATVTPTFVGISASSGTITSGALNVTGNEVLASATGNVANQSLVLNGTSPKAAVVTTQTNYGNTTATISGAVIGIESSATNINNTSTVSGNTIMAMAGGNSATTTIVAKH